MNRRGFCLLGSAGLVTLGYADALAQAATSSQLLQKSLTPMGAERAGNAAGTIPAWNGGLLTVPSDWDPKAQIVPDFWMNETPHLTVDASNMTQYSAQLSEGVKYLIQNVGFSLKVFQTYRTAAAPNWVYDNIAKNATRAKLNPGGGRLGFTGGYGGVPFPIPDVSDPLSAGAQIIWNHICRWQGTFLTYNSGAFVVESSGLPTLASGGVYSCYSPYYDPDGAGSAFNGYQSKISIAEFAPATNAGETDIAFVATNPLHNPDVVWVLLLGQGRIRKAPQNTYDTPNAATDGIANYDENYGFEGALDEYDWKLLGKREMLIPYNNNALLHTPALSLLKPKFLDPAVIRWELHRVWVVEATLHAGRRNVLARRRMYVDEDTWCIVLADAWDANGNIYKEEMTFCSAFPNLPGTILLNNATYNLQTGQYSANSGPWGNAPYNKPVSFDPVPETEFDPQAMAAAASY